MEYFLSTRSCPSYRRSPDDETRSLPGAENPHCNHVWDSHDELDGPNLQASEARLSELSQMAATSQSTARREDFRGIHPCEIIAQKLVCLIHYNGCMTAGPPKILSIWMYSISNCE